MCNQFQPNEILSEQLINIQQAKTSNQFRFLLNQLIGESPTPITAFRQRQSSASISSPQQALQLHAFNRIIPLCKKYLSLLTSSSSSSSLTTLIIPSILSVNIPEEIYQKRVDSVACHSNQIAGVCKLNKHQLRLHKKQSDDVINSYTIFNKQTTNNVRQNDNVAKRQLFQSVRNQYKDKIYLYNLQRQTFYPIKNKHSKRKLNAFDDDDDKFELNDIEWYIQLASQCYVNGVQLHIEHLNECSRQGALKQRLRRKFEDANNVDTTINDVFNDNISYKSPLNASSRFVLNAKLVSSSKHLSISKRCDDEISFKQQIQIVNKCSCQCIACDFCINIKRRIDIGTKSQRKKRIQCGYNNDKQSNKNLLVKSVRCNCCKTNNCILYLS